MTEKIYLKELNQRVEPDMCGDGGQNQGKEVDVSHRLAGPNARLIGMPGGLRELTTPALVLDLEAFERNIKAYQHQINLHGLQARPHAKSHKCAEIARRQIAAGAVGVCTASLHEAEALVGQGINNILITSPVIGAGKLDRLMQLLERGALVAVVVDDQEHTALMAAAAHRSGHVLDVLIDVDLGMGRTGISNIESALQLVNVVCEEEGISYRGIQAYSGRVQHIEEFAERDHVYTGHLRFLSELIAALDKRGLKPATVSGGGTGTLALDCREGILTEHQAGSYIFMDVEYGAVALRANDADAEFATSLFLHSTVISKNVPGTVTIDAGLKSFATDGPLPRVSAGAPVGTTYSFFGDEHGCLTFPTPSHRLPLGGIVALVTPHCDPTINLHDYLHVVRHDTIVGIWQIVGRGVL
jgi:D-serine deaminase-like pyridoxal phosphate-dependent protein